MKLLLDTHALLWWLDDSVRLGRKARRLIADPETEVLVSTVSFWEIVVKVRVGKLQAELGDIIRASESQGFRHLAITRSHLRALEGLPVHHRDPFDHLLIAQAITEAATFLTADGFADRYPVTVASCSD